MRTINLATHHVDQTEDQKYKRHLHNQNKNISDKELNEQMFNFRKKKFTSTFKSVSREQQHLALTDNS